MSDIVERTALAAFTLDGKPVRQGQVIAVDPLQLARLVKAGCVVESEAENAAVPKADLPATQTAGLDFQRDVDDAATQATRTIAAIRQRVEDAQKSADTEIASHRDRVVAAEKDADAEIAGHRQRTAEADRAMAAHREAHTQTMASLDAELAAKRVANTEAETGAEPPAIEAGKSRSKG